MGAKPMIDTITTAVVASIAIFFAGYLTPKYFIWGGITTIVVSGCYLLLPGKDAATPIAEMMPTLMALWTVYIRASGQALDLWSAEYGTIGWMVMATVSLVFLAPYLSGIWFGVTTWPELALIRVIL